MNTGIEIERGSVHRDRDTQTVAVALTINGTTGSVTFKRCPENYEVRGKFASHTGFRSNPGSITGSLDASDDDALYDLACRIATERFTESVALPFLVGNEHKEFGWKMLQRNYKGQIETRLPLWQEGVVSAELEAIGLKQTCPINNYWIFEEGVTFDDAKAILAPLMANETRLMDERRLAQQLRDAITGQGFLPGELMSQGGIQPSLF